MSKHLALAAVVVATLCACGPRNIPGTNIANTDENHAILRVIADYKTAYEARDADGVLRLVSPKFYETNGTPDPADDYDFKGLQKILVDEFKQVENPGLDIDVRKVDVKGDEAVVDYYYTARFQLAKAGPNGGFKSSADVAEIRMHREDGGWKIVSGL